MEHHAFRSSLSAARFESLFTAIDARLAKGNSLIVAIDGSSASGKTTLAALLAEKYDCNVFHMDDFFLRLHQRTPERFAEPGGNVDYERFREEVLLPLARQQAFSYQPFSCSSMALAAAVPVSPKRLSIVEGAYSMHPALGDYADVSVFVQIDGDKQRARIEARNSPAFAARFFSEWIPLEQAYFAACHPAARCHIQLEVEL